MLGQEATGHGTDGTEYFFVLVPSTDEKAKIDSPAASRKRSILCIEEKKDEVNAFFLLITL